MRPRPLFRVHRVPACCRLLVGSVVMLSASPLPVGKGAETMGSQISNSAAPHAPQVPEHCTDIHGRLIMGQSRVECCALGSEME